MSRPRTVAGALLVAGLVFLQSLGELAEKERAGRRKAQEAEVKPAGPFNVAADASPANDAPGSKAEGSPPAEVAPAPPDPSPTPEPFSGIEGEPGSKAEGSQPVPVASASPAPSPTPE